MNPNEIPGWLDQHGGADGPPQTDANGVTTHRARDGSYVTVFNGQVRMIGSPPMQGDEQAPAQPAQRPGGGMDQAALEAKIAELQKQYPGLKFMGQSIKDKTVRKTNAFGDEVTETVRVPVVEWRDPATGYTLTAEVGEGGGTYTVTNDRLIEENKGDAGPKNQPGQRSQIEGTPVPGGGADNERPRMVTRDAAGKEIESRELTPSEMKEWRDNRERSRNPGGKTDAEVRAEADRNVPKPEKDGAGNWGYWDTKQTPPKWVQIQGGPAGETKKPVEIGGQWGVWENGPDGTPVWKPVNAPAAGAARKNIDAFTPDYSQPDLGLGAWSAQQRQKIGLPPDQGGITQDDYNAAAKEAHDQATVTLTNITNSQGVVRQQALDNQTQSNRLSDQGAGDLKDARAIYDATWKYANPNSDARFSTIPYLLQEMQKMREARMGTQTPMPALHPMFTNLATAAGVKPPPGAATGAATPPPPTSVPPAVTGAAAAASGAAPPNAIGAGAVGNQPTPSAPPVRDDWRTQPNAPTPVSEQARDDWRTPPPAAPVESLTPGPDPQVPEGEWVGGRVLQPPAAPVEEQMPEQGPGMAHPAYPVEVQQPTNFNPNSEEIPPYNPGPGAAGHRPGEPVGVVPGPVNGWARLALAQPTGTVAVQPQMQQQNPALQQAAQGAQQPLFDPFNTAGRLAAMGVPLSAISAAMGEMGLLPEEAMA